MILFELETLMIAIGCVEGSLKQIIIMIKLVLFLSVIVTMKVVH